MKRNKLITGFILAIIAGISCGVVFDSCKKKPTPDEDTDENPDTTAVVIPSVIDTVTHVKVYFDNSGSMAPYVSKNAGTKNNNLLKAVNALGKDYGKGTYKFDANLTSKEKGKDAPASGIAFNDFYSMIQKGQVANGTESLLNEILGNIANQLQGHPNELAVFFTDGILSGPSDEIKKDGEYTPKNIEMLSSDLRNALNGKNLAASVYRFNQAGFDGDYWYYDNSHKKYNQATRPLYAVVLGEPQEVKKFKSWVETDEAYNFKPDYVVHVGDQLPIKKGLGNAKFGVANNITSFKNSDVAKKENGLLVFTLPTSTFSGVYEKGYAYDYLKEKLNVSVNGMTLPETVRGKDNQEYNSIDLEGQNFVIRVPLAYAADKAKMRVSIPYERPSWILNNTSRNDKMDLSAYNTYMLDKFVGAVVDGVSGGTVENLFDQTITFNNKK